MNKNKVSSNPVNPLNSFLFKPIDSANSKPVATSIKPNTTLSSTAAIKE